MGSLHRYACQSQTAAPGVQAHGLIHAPEKEKKSACPCAGTLVPEGFTHTWSINFMSDALSNGTKFRSLHVLDDYNREALFMETDYSLKSSRVI